MVVQEIDMDVLEICRKVSSCEQSLELAKNDKDYLEKKLETVNEMIPKLEEELRELLSILSSGVYTDIDNIDDNNIV
ncbi:hypothetical protein [Lachnospira sp.]|jgi:predicted translin family RNA/ssDNA-binding protein|uniref:hypothetical protein n=1 Tax=Lachnospira sp. TaxID=2049031 RepID=UPI00257DB55A|nr:hypothetical protein [Lachnospira sp.]